MTAPQEPDVTEPADVTDPASDTTRSRQAIGLWIGAGIGLLVVGAVLFVTLVAGGDGGSSDGQAASGSSTTIEQTGSIPEQLKKPLEIPKGDYTAYCKELIAEAPPITGELDPATMATIVEAMDFEKLITLAPEGLRPDLQVLLDSKDDVVTVMGQVESLDDVAEADFPEGFLDAAIQVSRVSTEKCS